MVKATPARVHGFDVVLNEGDTYPAIVAAFPFFNAPLVELIEQMRLFRERPLVVVDVGAAIGDTVLLLQQRCSGAVEKFICVEGNSEFLELLRANVSRFDNVQIVAQLLARERRSIPSLVQHHPGSAAASGDTSVEAIPLDEIAALDSVSIDVLKVDVDGSDGEVLAGAWELLNRCKPAVIFEWHPKLIEQTGSDCHAAFIALTGCGYDRFLWFTNTGLFNHFEEGFSPVVVSKLASYLLAVNHRADEHFDVIALHPSHAFSELDLAVMNFARRAAELG